MESLAVVAARSRIRHSVLENQLLNCSADFIVKLHAEDSAASARFTQIVSPSGDFFSMIEEAGKLADAMVHALSPARLLDLQPLADLPEETRCTIGHMLHSLYLQHCDTEGLRNRLNLALDAFKEELRQFAQLWQCTPRTDERTLHAAFERLRASGRLLHKALGDIPQGLVLP